jgi:hypothetical protein
LSFCIIFSSVSVASALDIELPKSLNSFTEDVAELINDYEELYSSENVVFFTAADDGESDETFDITDYQTAVNIALSA